MTSVALTAILGSAVLHAVWNAMLKGARDPSAASIAIVAGAATLSGMLGFALGTTHVPVSAWPYLLAAGIVEGIYFVTLGRALELLPLGSAYGISRGLGLLVVWPFSVWWLAEPVQTWSLGGAALLSLGLFFLVTKVTSRRGLAWALGCAATIAAYPLAYKRALLAGVDPYPLFALALLLALPFQFANLGAGAPQRLTLALREGGWRLGLAAVICAASFLLFLVALGLQGAGRVTALRNTSVLFASLFGWAMGEPRTKRGLASALAVTAGAVLLTLE